MFDIKKQLMWSKLRVGFVITLALLIIFLTIFFAANIEEMLSPKAELRVQFQNVQGLRKGAPVWVSGIEVGSVKNISLNPVYGTVVTLSIEKNALGFLKKDSEATIMTMGLLGDKYIELSNGTRESEQLKLGEMIKGGTQINLQDIMQSSAVSIERLTKFIIRLEGLIENIKSGKGTISKFITDPSVYDNLKETSESLSSILKDIKESQGTIRMLIEDPALYNRMVAATSSLEEFSRKVNESSGTVNKLLEDPTLYNKMLSASSSIEEFSKNLNEAHGTLKRLIEDPKLYENLDSASKQLSSILERIDSGEGVAGSLIKDKELATDLKETLKELKELTDDIKENPRKYFKFSIF
jgi:phospholipid/cholesterol/gamma-HCH transport system substrate-binding protein